MVAMAVVLAAGDSRRLMPLTKETPKPMLLVGGKPFLVYIIEWLKRNGITEILMTLHYHPEKIIQYFGDGSNFDLKINYSYEENLLDTAGSLKKNEQILRDDFLVLSGSYYLPSFNLADFWQYHLTKKGIGTIALRFDRNWDIIKHLGQGIFDQNNQLVYFEEKPLDLVSHYIHTTYQIYSPEIFKFIPASTAFSIPRDLIPYLIKSGQKIYSFIIPDHCSLIAISTKEMYQHAQQLIKHYQQKISHADQLLLNS